MGGSRREEGVVLELSVSGACGNAASTNCTVGLNLKYTPLCRFASLFLRPSSSFSGDKMALRIFWG